MQRLMSDELKAAKEEFQRYVVEKRRQYADDRYSMGDIPNVIQFLLRDFGFQSRVHLFQLFKICCLVVGVPDSNLTPVTIDLGGCAISASTVQDCLLLVQSFVLCLGYIPVYCVDAVRDAVSNAGVVFVSADFHTWAGLFVGDVGTYFSSYKSLYLKYLLSRLKSCESHYVERNKANCRARGKQSSGGSQSNRPQSVVGKRKNKPAQQSKNTKKSSNLSSSGDVSVTKKTQNKPKTVDPDVVHKVKKP